MLRIVDPEPTRLLYPNLSQPNLGQPIMAFIRAVIGPISVNALKQGGGGNKEEKEEKGTIECL